MLLSESLVSHAVVGPTKPAKNGTTLWECIPCVQEKEEVGDLIGMYASRYTRNNGASAEPDLWCRLAAVTILFTS